MPTSDRIVPLDIMRGLAIIAMCVAHFSQAMEKLHPLMGAAAVLVSIGRIATPSFLLVSGTTVAYILSCSDSGWQFRVADRATFLLLVGHWAINLPHILSLPDGVSLGTTFWITDVIACGLLLASALVRRVEAGTLTVIGISCLGLSWVGAAAIVLGQPLSRNIAVLILGFDSSNLPGGPGPIWSYVAPVVPYLGIFFLGAALGRATWRDLANPERYASLAARLLTLGIALCAAAVAGKVTKDYFLVSQGPGLAAVIYESLKISAKIPPSAAYVAWNSGVSLCLAAGVLAIQKHGRYTRLLRPAALLGRAGFFVFFLQYWFYRVGGNIIDYYAGGWWPLMLLLTLLAIWTCAWVWDRGGCNRYFTVGLPKLRLWWQSTQAGDKGSNK